MTTRRRAEPADLPALWALRTRAIRAGRVGHYPPELIDIWCEASPPETMGALIAC